MADKKPRKISPQAAKILEQYRQAGQKSGAAGTGGAPSADGSGATEKTTGPAAPGAQMRRSGNRGK
ncbi:MAG: hypothetical protein QM758_19250 [Armatimonas sp.]